jgi:hypothetical protein
VLLRRGAHSSWPRWSYLPRALRCARCLTHRGYSRRSFSAHGWPTQGTHESEARVEQVAACIKNCLCKLFSVRWACLAAHRSLQQSCGRGHVRPAKGYLSSVSLDNTLDNSSYLRRSAKAEAALCQRLCALGLCLVWPQSLSWLCLSRFAPQRALSALCVLARLLAALRIACAWGWGWAGRLSSL